MTAPLTAAELSAIEERTNAASAGPWHVEARGGNPRVYVLAPDAQDTQYAVCLVYAQPSSRDIRARNAEFMAHARQDVPRLLATVKALRTTLLGLGWTDVAIDHLLGGFASMEARR